ncbi:MAG TPA: hypothetical protein DIU48_13700 [Acidobacteria bacterium]|nr:hypothetical protein [Acidobacteriota bacterium]
MSEVTPMSRYMFSCVLLLRLLSTDAFAAQACEPDGEVRFVCGLTNPEDLYRIPDTPWVIASGRVSDVEGPIYAVDIRNYSSRVVFPENTSLPEHDNVTYQDCPGPNTSSFQPHGLTLREGNGGVHTLYVVGHGEREAIEVFDLDVRGTFPSLKWIGCIVAPEGTRRINSISALPDGAIAATNFDTAGGELWEWHPANGWTEVPGSQMPGPNGLVSSADGRWFYIGGWSDQALVRLSRGTTPVQMEAVPVGFNVDNVRWGTDGTVVVAGHVTRCDSDPCELAVARVAKVHPTTFNVQQLVDYKGTDFFQLGTVAIEVDDEIWVGGIRGSLGIARFPQ